jgi:hypothetical protein
MEGSVLSLTFGRAPPKEPSTHVCCQMILKIVVSGMNNFYSIFSSWRYYVKKCFVQDGCPIYIHIGSLKNICNYS